VAAGGAHSCAILGDHTAKCWGFNDEGQLGNGTWITRTQPTAVERVVGITQIVAGNQHTCARLDDGSSVQCWGFNDSGQLGDGNRVVSQETRGLARPVPGLPRVTQLAAGGDRTCALGDGTVWCWGANPDGANGNGSTVDSVGPVKVPMLADVVGIAVGSSHTCAIKSGGSVWCWGHNGRGQLGDGTTTNSFTPVAVTGGVRGIDQIAARDDFTCAHSMDDSVWCWGADDDGELGDGRDPNHDDQNHSVRQLTTLSGAKTVVVGLAHACARKGDGTLWCWGASNSGQLGDGDYNDPGPVRIPGISDVRDLALGNGHTCALLGDGSVSCWGDDRNGQLGDGILARGTPVAPRLQCP
jgi:alpha-tubulin suppressor-like RCC1 family protein